MSSNPQGEPWFSDKPTPEPPFRGPARTQAKKDDIPDNWEDDDGGDEGQTQTKASTLLQAEADTPAQSQGGGEKPPIAATSMASPLVKKRASPASYGDSGPSLPSFQPTMRILKRSTNTTGATAAPTTASPQKSLVEREREYQQARERIFGSTSNGAVSSSDNIPKDSGVPVVVQRQPRGPSSGDAVGFRRQTNHM